MNLFTRTFSKIFKSSNQQELDKIQNIILAINDKENEIKSLSESDIKERTFNLKKSVQNGDLKLSEIQNTNTKVYTNGELISFEYSATSKNSFYNPSIFLHTKYGLPVKKPIINLSIDSKNLSAKFLFNKELINDDNKGQIKNYLRRALVFFLYPFYISFSNKFVFSIK